MKKIIINISLLAVVGIIAFIAGRYSKDDKIRIIKETETKFEYIKEAKTEKELLDAYKSPLKIFTTVKENNWIEIIAEDDYKRATKRIKIGTVQKNNFIYTNIGFKIIQVNYYRRFGDFMLGGGISYPGNIYVGAGYNF